LSGAQTVREVERGAQMSDGVRWGADVVSGQAVFGV
jgi:hypothetical protein